MALHMSTIVSRKTADIVAHIDRLRPRVAGSSLLYAISTTNQTQPSDVSHLYSSLKTLSEDSVGCLAAPIPSSRPSWQRSFAVSVASFDPKHATLFRSTIPGRKAVQVGRWRAPDQHGKQPDRGEYSEDIEWGKAFAQFSGTTSLPPSIEHLSTRDIGSIVYFTDGAPEGLSNALSKFEAATKLGLIATSTPFVSGRPYTLFHGDSVHSDGAVGVCLSSQLRTRHHSEFPGLEGITRPMIITNSEGNLVHSLDNANPTRLLLHAIQNHPAVSSTAGQNISKDLQLYLGTLVQRNGKRELGQLYHITSGDPSRGSLALDSDAAPAEGSLAQMFLLTNSEATDLPLHHDTQTSHLSFVTTSLEDLEDVYAAAGNDETLVLSNTFLAASENGCIVSRATNGDSEHPWKCTVPGSSMGIQWI